MTGDIQNEDYECQYNLSLSDNFKNKKDPNYRFGSKWESAVVLVIKYEK